VRWLRNLLALPTRVAEIHNRMEAFMADVSPILHQLATDLRTFAAGPFAALVARNAELEARNAELEGEDASESSAADDAVTAFNELVAPVTASPDVPVEIPPVEVPTDSPDVETAPES
jgi:hypothetical protein